MIIEHKIPFFSDHQYGNQRGRYLSCPSTPVLFLSPSVQSTPSTPHSKQNKTSSYLLLENKYNEGTQQGVYRFPLQEVVQVSTYLKGLLDSTPYPCAICTHIRLSDLGNHVQGNCRHRRPHEYEYDQDHPTPQHEDPV
ncbi:hypothetical protein I7I50_06475 [Histoplasma capsulatum G186AR]|uniref:Uncharacterized protein n=1 Tax=Ajellomyces capsulatus TaxID=5037 RepID=A0A8H7YWQ1_AJECA|nr:hypothetical protein I7I52_10453 [Histoplasma capsulatum]QSS67406.1 hypothetical protein I7I50_06475 [Histoplasma capsulatum G186AR]